MQNTKLKRRDRSTISKGEYLFNHIFYGTVLAFDLYAILPLIVPIAVYHSSIPSVAFCTLLANVSGILLDFRYNRSVLNSVRDAVIGAALYVLFTLGRYAAVFTKWLLLVTVVLSAIGILVIAVRKINRNDDIMMVIRIKAAKSIRLLQRNLGISAVIVVIALPVIVRCFPNGMVFEDFKTFHENGELSVNQVYGDEFRLSKNIETIKLIRDDDVFQKLDYDKKCEVLKACIYCEGRYLGLCEIQVEFRDDMEEREMGSYNHAARTISINAKAIKEGATAEELLHACLHECRHCYQHLMAELYRQADPSQRNLYAFAGENVGEWVKNIGNYQDNDGTMEGMIAYRMQALEQDAEDYAWDSVLTYYHAIDEILDDQAQNE